MDSVRNLESVNVIDEIRFANAAIEVMKGYVRAMEEEEKRRQLASKLRLHLQFI